MVAWECNSIGCKSPRSYGHAGTNTPEFCSDHKEDGMVDLDAQAKKGEGAKEVVEEAAGKAVEGAMEKNKGKAKAQVAKVVVEEAAGKAMEEAMEKNKGKAKTQVAEKVVEEAAGQANVVEMEVEDPGTIKTKARKPRAPRAAPRPKRASHSDVFEKLGSRDLFLKASVSNMLKKKRSATKETRYVTPRTAYMVLGLVLTRDSTKSLVWGEVFFDSQLFETPMFTTSHTTRASWVWRLVRKSKWGAPRGRSRA